VSKISELSDGGSLLASDYLLVVRSGGNVKVRMDQINVDQVDLGDNEFIRLGNSQDLTMVHTSTQSIINQAGIGDLLLQKAGATKLTINATGIDVTGTVTADSLGIGTSSVATKLHVMGNSTVRNTLVSTLTLDAGISASNPYTNFGTGIDFKGRDYSNAIRNYGGIYSIMIGNTSPTTPAGDAGFNSALTFYTNTGGASGTNPTEKMRLDSSGTLLVGRTGSSGLGKLNVEGGADFTGGDVYLCRDSGNLLVAGTNTNPVGNNVVGHALSSDGRVQHSTTGNTVMKTNQTTDGDIAQFRVAGATVGSIGSTSGYLFIGGTAGNDAFLSFGADGVRPATSAGAARDAAIDLGGSTNRFKDLYLSGTAYAGDLLAGKTSISAAIVGSLIRGSTGESFFSIESANNTLHVYDTTNSLYRFYVTSNGGISNYSANNINLSDEREKKNVEALPSQWDCLKHWDLKQFHYNADDDALPKKYGVIAQEIEAHCPEVIDVFNVDEDTERKGVKEQQMMWMAIKALQEAQTRIETLEGRIAALES